jgi:hypothetical protein
MQMPDAAALAELKRADPQAHKMWLREVKSQLRHQRFMESARYRMPMRVILATNLAAVVALLILSAMVGYVAYLDHAWLAAFLGALDFVGVVGLFLRVMRDDGPSDDS